MIQVALKMLTDNVDRATQDLTKIRTEIVDSFSKDYVITPSTATSLIKAQKAVQHWTKISNILARAATVEEQVAGLQEWSRHATEQLLECGRSSSTSLVATAEMQADEDELKQVLRSVRQCLDFVSRNS